MVTFVQASRSPRFTRSKGRMLRAARGVDQLPRPPQQTHRAQQTTYAEMLVYSRGEITHARLKKQSTGTCVKQTALTHRDAKATPPHDPIARRRCSTVRRGAMIPSTISHLAWWRLHASGIPNAIHTWGKPGRQVRTPSTKRQRRGKPYKKLRTTCQVKLQNTR